MKLTEDFNNILTDEERAKYVKGDELDFGDDHEASLDFLKRWCKKFRERTIAGKKEVDELFEQNEKSK